MTENQMYLGVDYAKGKDLRSLLVIELEHEDAVPKIIYQGKEIKGIANIHFKWTTKTARKLGYMNFEVNYFNDSNELKTLSLSKNDESRCPKCGNCLDITSIYREGEEVYRSSQCLNCDYEKLEERN